MSDIEKAVEITFDLAVPVNDQTALTLFPFRPHRSIQVVLIPCEGCHKPSDVLILNKKTNQWVGYCCLPVSDL